MNISKKTSLIAVLIIFNIGMGAVLLFNQLSKPKVGYVQLGKLYNEFKMKTELEGKLDNVSNARKLVLDSIEMNLKMLALQIKNASLKDANRQEHIQQFELKRQEYLQKKQTFEEDNGRTTAQYEEQIWKQLNQYVTDYGKENGFKAIMGADGNGALMYAEQEMDMTKEICVYVNEKYKGTK